MTSPTLNSSQRNILCVVTYTGTESPVQRDLTTLIVMKATFNENGGNVVTNRLR